MEPQWVGRPEIDRGGRERAIDPLGEVQKKKARFPLGAPATSHRDIGGVTRD